MKTREMTLWVFAVLLMAVGTVSGQEKRISKMSPRTRLQLMENHDAALRSKAANGKTMMLSAFIRVKDASVLRGLERAGCRIGVVTGEIATIRMPLLLVDSISRLPGVERIEAAEPLRPTLDSARSVVRVDAVHAGRGLKMPYRGKGVIVGVVDDGFDYTHPTFYSADGSRYRVVRAEDIHNDTVQVWPDSASILSRKCSFDGTSKYHGTHVAGIAGGSGGGTPYAGLAPESDLMLVATDYININIIEGVADIFHYADSVKRPAVVNLSLGSPSGPHDDVSLYGLMLGKMVGKGRIVVASAGNERQNHVHMALTQPGGTRYTFVLPQSMTGNKVGVDLWSGKAGGTFSASIDLIDAYTKTSLGGSGFISATADSTTVVKIPVGSSTYQVTLISQRDSSNGKNEILIGCSYPDGINKRYGYMLRFTSPDSLTNAWARLNCQLFSYGMGAPYTDGDSISSICTPACCSTVIAVGASNARGTILNHKGQPLYEGWGAYGDMARYSSCGPRADGGVKPDITAPGTNVVSALNSFYDKTDTTKTDHEVVTRSTFRGKTYEWMCTSGTSMSCPVVAGTIALWLQANPNLTKEDLMGVFARTSTQKAGLSYPRNDWGYGIINAYKGLLDVVGTDAVGDVFAAGPAEAVSVYPGSAPGELHVRWAETPREYSIRVYDPSGARVGWKDDRHPVSPDVRVSIRGAMRTVLLVRITTEKGTVKRQVAF